MVRKTTTKKINDAITNNLLQLKKAEVYHKTIRKTEILDNDTVIENLEFLCESGVFVDCVGWTFERDYRTNSYIAECSRMDGNAENIVTLYLSVGDGTNVEDVERMLVVEEVENFAEKV